MTNAVQQDPSVSLTGYFAERYGVDPKKLLSSLAKVAFVQSDGSSPTNEQLLALLVVAKEYDLSPFTKEICALPVRGSDRIIPYVCVDGWFKFMNRHPNYDGYEYRTSDTLITPAVGMPDVPEWGEVTIYDKVRSHPTVVREYFTEVFRVSYGSNGRILMSSPWVKYPRRMLRHKVLMQGIRMAFGFGLPDFDDAVITAQAEEDAIADITDVSPVDEPKTQPPKTEAKPDSQTPPAHETKVHKALTQKPAPKTVKRYPTLADGKACFDKFICAVADKAVINADNRANAMKFITENYAGEDFDAAMSYLKSRLADAQEPQALS